MKKILFALLLGFALTEVSCQEKNDQKSTQNSKAALNETIDVDAFQKKQAELKDVQLLDVRTPDEYNEGHLKGALNIDWRGTDFADQVAKLDKNKPVMVYCLGGGRSSAAAEKMQEMGFTTIYNMEGGFMKWTNANKPVDYPQSALGADKGMSNADYLKMVSADKNKYVLVDFNAKWCGPCRKMMPMLEKITAERKDKLTMLQVDADQNKGLLKEKGISSIPYFELYKEGKLVWKHTGYMDEESFLKESGL